MPMRMRNGTRVRTMVDRLRTYAELVRVPSRIPSRPDRTRIRPFDCTPVRSPSSAHERGHHDLLDHAMRVRKTEGHPVGEPDERDSHILRMLRDGSKDGVVKGQHPARFVASVLEPTPDGRGTPKTTEPTKRRAGHRLAYLGLSARRLPVRKLRRSDEQSCRAPQGRLGILPGSPLRRDERRHALRSVPSHVSSTLRQGQEHRGAVRCLPVRSLTLFAPAHDSRSWFLPFQGSRAGASEIANV